MSDYIDIFEETTCPSMEVLDHYLAHELNSGEQQKIEAHLLDCPLCADALEGLSMVSDRKSLRYRIKHIKQINQQRLFTVHEKRRENLSKRQSRVRPMKIAEVLIASAASIAILLATIFVIFQVRKNDLNQIAQNKALENPTLAPSVPIDSATSEEILEALVFTDSAEIDQNTLFAEVKEKKEESRKADKRKIAISKPSSSIQPEKVFETRVLQENALETTNSKPKIGKEEQELTAEVIAPVDTSLFAEDVIEAQAELPRERKDISLRVEEEQAKADTYSLNKENNLNPRMRTPSPSYSNQSKEYGSYTKSEVLENLTNEGKSYYRQERYEEALSRFYEVLQSDRKNNEALFFVGKIQIALGQFDAARKSLQKIRKDDTFGEEAKWQLITVYSELKKQERLRKLLDEISTTNGKYAPQAKEMLKKLEEKEN